MSNIFKQLLAPSWQLRQQAAQACSQYYSDINDLPTETQMQLDEWLLELGEQKTLYLTAILSFWAHVSNLKEKYKAANSRHINAFYQANIDRAACESWRKHELEKNFPLDENDETLEIDWLSNPSKPLHLITTLKHELVPLQQQLVDTFPNLDHGVSDSFKRTLSQMPQISDQTYQSCLAEFRDSYETGNCQEFAQHINTPARVDQWLYLYSLEENRDSEILDRYLDIAEYAPQDSAAQILTGLVAFYQRYPALEKTPQLLHAFTSLCRSSGSFHPFVVDFGMEILELERNDEFSLWGEVLIYFLTAYDVTTYQNDIVYFLDHPYERYHYTAYAALPAIDNINDLPTILIGRLIKCGLFEGRFDPNFGGRGDQFFVLVKSIKTSALKQFEPLFKKALTDYLDFCLSEIIVEDILPILQYLTEQGIDLRSDIKTIIEKLKLKKTNDASLIENLPRQSMDEILAQSKVDMIKQGLSDNEADLKLQQSMLFVKQLFGVAENQTLEEKLKENSQKPKPDDRPNETDILIEALKKIIL